VKIIFHAKGGRGVRRESDSLLNNLNGSDISKWKSSSFQEGQRRNRGRDQERGP